MMYLVTGAAGSIACSFVRHELKKHPDDEIVVHDKLTYVSRMENLERAIAKVTFVKGDI